MVIIRSLASPDVRWENYVVRRYILGDEANWKAPWADLVDGQA